ncbi:MAG: GNAT family N-acetyltransferase [Gaiellales bacterium]
MPLPDGFAFRQARLADGPAVMKMLNDETEALIGMPLADLHWVTSPWTAPDADQHRYEVVVDGGERIVGYLSAECRPPHTEVFGIGAVAIDHHGRGLGGAILDEIESHAASLAERAPAGQKVLMRMGALADEPHVSALLAARGYVEVRRFVLMRADFDGPPNPPREVRGIAIRPFETGQEGEVYRCVKEAFADHWGDDEETEEVWVHHHMSEDHFFPDLWLLAWDGDRLAGVLIALPTAAQEPTHGYVGSLGVRRAFRGRGIGEALLRACFVRFAKRGCKGALLHVDSDSLTGANRLYERVGMRAIPQFATWEKELVAGRESTG